MAKVYKYSLFSASCGDRELPCYLGEGEAVSVDGVAMVRLGGGYIHPADGYEPSKSAAMVRAADEIEQLGRRLLEQASRMRAEAWTLSRAVLDDGTTGAAPGPSGCQSPAAGRAQAEVA